jgi:hypothetical protein
MEGERNNKEEVEAIAICSKCQSPMKLHHSWRYIPHTQRKGTPHCGRWRRQCGGQPCALSLDTCPSQVRVQARVVAHGGYREAAVAQEVWLGVVDLVARVALG